jgi:hypothetical protein
VLRELAELREDAAALAGELARARLRRAQGLSPEVSLLDLVEAHPLAASGDGLAQARETLGNAEAEDPRRPGRVARLASLRDFLLRVRALSLEPGAAQELWDLPSRPLVRPPGDAGLHGALPAVAVERELPLLRARERRAELEAALADAMVPFDGARSACWEAAQAALNEAGFSNAGQGVVALQARGWGEVGSAEKLLAATEPLARDLGGWLLERHTGARPHPGGAERHDVLHLIHAPHCASAFPRGELLRTVRRWAEMLRLDLGADNCIQLDEDDRPLKQSGAQVEPVDPPFEVRISLLPEEGPRALGQLLGAVSVAQLRAGPPGDAPPEDLWLGDPAVSWACFALLEGLLREPEFLQRCAKAELGRDDERAIAIAAVLDARLAAARTLASLQAHEVGLGGRASHAHRELFARAAGADLPAGLALCDLDPWLDSFAELRGRALAARARAFLRDRYDEDWWRNPRALASLNALWARGGRPTVAEIWAELGGAPGIEPLVSALEEACR